MAELSPKEGSKTCRKWIKTDDFVTVFFTQFERETNNFHPYFDDISAICWLILMQDTVLEKFLVVENMTEIWIRNLQNFVLKLVP
jgi:hypothetical protein